MPQNFPEVWESRVRELLTTSDVAPWLDGIPELEADVYTLGENTATEKNIIHIPVETFSPDVLLNNTTYPIAIQDFADGTVQLTLDKYQTKATSVSDDAAMGASYPKIDSATRGHRRQINSTKYKKAAHAIAPASHTTATPVFELPASYTANDVFQAMVKVKDAFDKNEIPESNRRFVLATDHYNKLITDRERFGNLLVDHNTGKVNQQIAGFDVYTFVSNPKYDATTKAKKVWGAVPAETDKVASFAFYVDNIGKKTGNTKQYFSLAAANPTTQTNLLNYRHYFIAMPVQNQAIGAII